MSDVTFIEIETLAGTETHALIAHADGSFTSMSKAEYERQQAEQSTPILPGDAN